MDKAILLKEIILRLIYSEIFEHPLTFNELEQRIKAPSEDLSQALTQLTETELIHFKNGYYFIFEEGNKINRRTSGNEEAERMMPKAQRVGKKIFRFPYVEGVGISGSLSKGVLHDDGDFDYFIITKPNRLWVARTLLILYKKVFLFNSRKHFCVNYFIDTQNLEIEEKNPFTATEIATLIPVAGNVMDSFFEKNIWIANYLRENKKETHFSEVNKPAITRFIVFLTKGKFGEWTDQRFMHLTLKRWERKFGAFDNSTFDLTMKSRKYVSKHHPNNFQQKVLSRMDELLAAYRAEHTDALKKLAIEL